VGDKPEWHGVKHIQPSSTGFGCVSIGSGMDEMDMDEDEVARFTAVSFGLLALVMLGLTVLDHL
jgi:hypothetical protein